jgi:para-nitrobenzyl esterase
MQSGSVNLIQDRAMADATAEAYRTALGNPALAQLRAMSATELLAAQVRAQKVMGGAIPAAPYYDNDLLPASQADIWAQPPAPVKLLAGYTREETALFEKLPFLTVRVDRTFLDQQVNHELAPDQARELLAHYPQDKAGARALATDLYFGNSTHHTAERQSRHASCWFYRFDYRHPLLGAAHTLELTFLWDLKGPLWALARGGPLNGKRLALAQTIREHWVAFVRDGDPGENWRPFDEESRQIMLFDFASTLANDPLENSRSAWNGVNITPRYRARSR